MGVKLSEKRAETKVFTVKWGEDDVDVCYRVNAVTPRLLEEVDKAAQEDNLSMLATLLVPILEWWDILEDDGSRLPVTDETVMSVPMRWITTLQRGLEKDQAPLEDETSDGG